jgi:putative flippase GtrA
MPGVPHRLTAQALRFAAVGAVSTLAYLLLFLLFRPAAGAQAANLLALLLTAVGNTAANRRLTFGVRGPGAGRQQLQGLAVFALGLALTSGALWLLQQASAHPGRAVELAVLVVANLLATALRFVLLREWVFRTKEASR